MSRSAGEIVIAGGGVGGLAAALALAKRGIPSIVCERRAAFSEDGAGIQIGPNGVKVLRAVGVADALQDFVSAPDGISVRQAATARELTRLPLGQWIAARHDAPYWTAHRQDLHAALSSIATASPLIAFRLGAEIKSWRETESGVEAVTSTGETIAGRALIAADGLWSRLREKICASSPPMPVGKAAFRCVAPRASLPQDLAAGDVHIWLAPGAHVVHYPVRAGRDVALVLIVDDQSAETQWNIVDAPDLSSPTLKSFAPPLRRLLEAGDGWRKWSLHTAPPLDRWTAGPVALLGDAAHPILPFLAQGAVLALEDADLLADCLESESDTPAALERYAAARKPRAKSIAAAAARNGRIYHLRGAACAARDATLRLTPPSRLMTRYDWVYGWRS